MSSVAALDTTPTHLAFHECASDMGAPQNTGGVMALPTNSANDLNYDGAEVRSIQTNNPEPTAMQVENAAMLCEIGQKSEVNPDGIAPITFIGELTYACERVGNLCAANEPEPEPVHKFVPETPRPTMTAPEPGMSGPS